MLLAFASTAVFQGASLSVRVWIWKCFTRAVKSSPHEPPLATRSW